MGELTTYATQNVTYFQAIPPDYHGIGSRIEWTATFQLFEKDGDIRSSCLRYTAYIPGNPREARC